MTELKKCPFCGKQHEWEHTIDFHWGDCWTISCNGRTFAKVFSVDDVEEVTRYYNTRPIEDSLRDELETLRAQYTAACVELANCGAAERLSARMMAEGKGE